MNFQRRNDKIKNAIVNSVKIYIYLYNNYTNGPANAITLSTYTTAVNANERSCTFRIRQSYYWNILFIQRQYNNQCCEHSLRALCTPYIDFNCPEYDRLGASIGGWRNIEVASCYSVICKSPISL